MRVFTLTVFTEQFTHVTVLAENGPLDCGEDCPRQNCAQVLPVLKGQGGQVNLVAHLHPHGTFGSSDTCAGAALTRVSDISFAASTASVTVAAAASAAAAAASVTAADFTSASAYASAASPNDQLYHKTQKEWSLTPTTPHIK